MENKECKYRLPCGWCDRKNKKCELTAESSLASVTKIDVNEKHYDTKLCSVTNRCGSCSHTDGMCYTSNPPQVKCTITGRFHFYDDVCDCNTIMATDTVVTNNATTNETRNIITATNNSTTNKTT